MATQQANDNGALVGYEAELWRMADTLRAAWTPPSTST